MVRAIRACERAPSVLPGGITPPVPADGPPPSAGIAPERCEPARPVRAPAATGVLP